MSHESSRGSKADPKAIEGLIEEHMEYARCIAVRIKRNLPPFILLDDLIGQAYQGLVEAAQLYRPSSNVPFRCYARHRIRGAIMDSLRRPNFQHTSTSQLGDDTDRIEALKTDPDIEDSLDRKKKALVLRKAIAELPPRDRRILHSRYWEGKNGKQTGEAIGKGESRSSQLHKRVLEEALPPKLRRYRITGAGYGGFLTAPH